jgi:hypothetical protein
MIGNAVFETGIARVDMESRRMTSVDTVMLLNILIGLDLFYNLFKKTRFLALTAFETAIVKVEMSRKIGRRCHGNVAQYSD